MVRNPLYHRDLPKTPEPYWRENIDLPRFNALKEDIETDVVIVGGGITGITTAYLLQREGLDVALLEADVLLNGTTGHTTAKLTAQHGLFYHELINHMGVEKARLYYEANQEAVNYVRNLVSEQNIDCDFSTQDACMYGVADRYANKVENEFRAYEKLNIPGDLTGSIPFDIKVKNALYMRNQAQFHPVKYLAHLVKQFIDDGGEIYEQTTAVNVDHGKRATAITRDGYRATGNYVLACSHYPFYDGLGFYYTRMYAERSYLLAVKTSFDYPGGMYLSADSPPRSIRSVQLNGETGVLIAGEDHKTGQGGNTQDHYDALESFAETVIGVEEVVNRWSAQDLYTLDKVPYIGRLTQAERNILVATGFKKWGMSSGTLSALLFRDYVLERENKYMDVFTPSRFYADPSLKTFFKQNADVAAHWVAGKLELPERTGDFLSNDEGGVIRYEGKRAGGYKDEDGNLYVVDTTCTHMLCETSWNEGDRTWDCPCHGSRFSYTGEVVEGPAEKPLKRFR
ncbi:MAG TPA: FAD-dependent oxidoreductase [Bacillales bacterium]|nr:FAD-dependent oxidoreductase [Bacillales bacterium]